VVQNFLGESNPLATYPSCDRFFDFYLPESEKKHAGNPAPEYAAPRYRSWSPARRMVPGRPRL
jgi:hypothetical protein